MCAHLDSATRQTGRETFHVSVTKLSICFVASPPSDSPSINSKLFRLFFHNCKVAVVVELVKKVLWQLGPVSERKGA
jgi:hypothetical protein